MWKIVKLGDIYDVGSSKRVLKSEWKRYGIPFYRGREITALSKHGFVDNDLFIAYKHYEYLASKYGVPEADDIMITAIGTIGNTYVAQENDRFYFKDASVLWLKKQEDVLSRYVQYWLLTNDFKSQLDKGNGATVDTLTIKKLSSVLLPLPSLAEQQRIIAKLDKAFVELGKAVGAYAKRSENAKRIYKYSIDELFGKHRANTHPIGDYSEINYGYTAKASFERGSFKFLRITDIQDGRVDWEKVPYCEVGEKKLTKVLLHDGDIVFARTGTTGKSFLVTNPTNAVFASYLIRISVDRAKLLPSYVIHYFQSTDYWRQVVEGISGTIQGGFNATKLGKLRIPIIDIEIQKDMTKRLDKIAQQTNLLSKIYKSQIERLRALKSAILTQELQGE